MRLLYALPLLTTLLVHLLMTAPASAAASVKKGEEAKSTELNGHSVDIGAVTFSVDSPMHKQYVVTKIAVEFLDANDATHYRQAGKIVRLRDVVLTTLLDIRPMTVETEIGQEDIEKKLHRVLAEEVPNMHSVKVAILGTRNVPRT